MATFNGANFITNQVDSILSQMNSYDELVVSDDNSTDDTVNILESYSDSRIKIIQNNKSSIAKPINRATKNFHNALKNCSGDIIFLCDQDDIWRHDKLDFIEKYFERNDDAILVVHDARLINSEGNTIQNSYFEFVNSGPGFYKNLMRNTYLGCCIAFKRELLQYILPFPRTLHAHDMWIGLIAETISNSHFLNQKLISYRRHDNTVTASGGKSKNTFVYKIYIRLSFVINYLNYYVSRKI